MSPTIKQEKFVKNLLENVSNTKSTSLEKVANKSGYGKISKQPSRIIKSKGVVQLFSERGFSPDKIAQGYEKLEKLPLKDKEISIDQKLKLYKQVGEIVIDNPEGKMAPQLQFIDKFLNIQMLKKNKPRLHPGKNTK